MLLPKHVAAQNQIIERQSATRHLAASPSVATNDLLDVFQLYRVSYGRGYNWQSFYLTVGFGKTLPFMVRQS